LLRALADKKKRFRSPTKLIIFSLLSIRPQHVTDFVLIVAMPTPICFQSSALDNGAFGRIAKNGVCLIRGEKYFLRRSRITWQSIHQSRVGTSPLHLKADFKKIIDDNCNTEPDCAQSSLRDKNTNNVIKFQCHK
jgi:hypothetical protein